MFIYKVIVFDNNLNTNIISFNEDLNGQFSMLTNITKKLAVIRKLLLLSV